MSEKQTLIGSVIETVKTVFYALLLAGLIRTLIFQPFWIPSGSMKPTLLIGDFLYVNKFAYGYSAYSCPTIHPIFPVVGGINLCGWAEGADDRLFGSEPQRGDVIVFRHPVSGQDYIKRLIALPGDTVEVRDGALVLNGTPVPTEQIEDFVETFARQGPTRSPPICLRAAGQGGDCVKHQFSETLPEDVSYSTLSVGLSRGDTLGPVRVPEGQFFFMGDNRDNSLDSRFDRSAGGVGFVPRENLIGRADRVIFSSSGASIFFFWTWRGDRFFRAVE
ncbi:MAG: signal peptidase I [Pseudomonadota bacterium]